MNEPGRSSTMLRNTSQTSRTGPYTDTPILSPTLSKQNSTGDPLSPAISPSVSGKDHSSNTFVDRISTLGRKNRIKQLREVTKLQEEGIRAFQQSLQAPSKDSLPPTYYIMDNNDERTMVEPASMEQESVKQLLQTLLDWINNELIEERILVRDLEEDIYDGQILQKLIHKFTGEEFDHPEITQSEMGQKQRLKTVLQHIEQELQVTPQWARRRWTVERIHAKDLVAILHLLVAMARHFAPSLRLPPRVHLNVIIVRKRENRLESSKETVDIINDGDGGNNTLSQERDVIDTLFEKAPDRVSLLEQSLLKFVNTHLNPLHFEVTDLVSQFQDGVLLILLMGALEGYFVPLYHYHASAPSLSQKITNVSVAFDLMEASGLPKPRDIADDIVHGERRAILRMLYAIFHRYQQELMVPQQPHPYATQKAC